MKIAFFGDSLTQGTIGSSFFSILEEKLPQHTLFNYGQNGDTVRSLLNRIRKIEFEEHFDLGFVWIGTNDILVQLSWSFPPMKFLQRQPWTPRCEPFKICYQHLLEFLQPRANHLITVSPLFIGEDLTNTWNQQLKQLGKTIKELSQKQNMQYLDLQQVFKNHQKTTPSPFIQKKVIGTIIDSLLYTTPSKIEQRSQQRHLQFTIDGIHLNQAGAVIIADTFLKTIQDIQRAEAQ